MAKVRCRLDSCGSDLSKKHEKCQSGVSVLRFPHLGRNWVVGQARQYALWCSFRVAPACACTPRTRSRLNTANIGCSTLPRHHVVACIPPFESQICQWHPSPFSTQLSSPDERPFSTRCRRSERSVAIRGVATAGHHSQSERTILAEYIAIAIASAAHLLTPLLSLLSGWIRESKPKPGAECPGWREWRSCELAAEAAERRGEQSRGTYTKSERGDWRYDTATLKRRKRH